MMRLMSDLDRLLDKCVNEMQRKYNCLVFLKHDGSRVFMDVLFLNMDQATDIQLGNVSDNKEALACAIRQWFRGEVVL